MKASSLLAFSHGGGRNCSQLSELPDTVSTLDRSPSTHLSEVGTGSRGHGVTGSQRCRPPGRKERADPVLSAGSHLTRRKKRGNGLGHSQLFALNQQWNKTTDLPGGEWAMAQGKARGMQADAVLREGKGVGQKGILHLKRRCLPCPSAQPLRSVRDIKLLTP